MYIPTKIHSQLSSYSVSGCYDSLRVLLTSIGGTRAESFSRFLLQWLGWRHLVNNLHIVAKMAAAILRHCSKNRETDSALVPPILVLKKKLTKNHNSHSHYNYLVVSVFWWVCTCRVVYFGVSSVFRCISVFTLTGLVVYFGVFRWTLVYFGVFRCLHWLQRRVSEWRSLLSPAWAGTRLR